jgi:hypothetical protein
VYPNGAPLGHGTHVAGTIGATANSGGDHVGVAWNVRLMACKAFNAQGGSASQQAYVSDTAECPHIAKDTVLLLTWTHASSSDVDIALTFLEG